MHFSTTFAFIVFATMALPSFAESIPRIEALDLNKKTIVWPNDLPVGKTVLIIGFDGKQQPNIDNWISGLQLKAADAPAWFEIPLIDDPGAIGRWFINNGMRSGIPSVTTRSHVVTVYGDKAKIMRIMGISGENRVHVLVVNQKGEILALVSGDYSAEGAKQINAIIAR
jgi:hypothetical protein